MAHYDFTRKLLKKNRKKTSKKTPSLPRSQCYESVKQAISPRLQRQQRTNVLVFVVEILGVSWNNIDYPAPIEGLTQGLQHQKLRERFSITSTLLDTDNFL